MHKKITSSSLISGRGRSSWVHCIVGCTRVFMFEQMCDLCFCSGLSRETRRLHPRTPRLERVQKHRLRIHTHASDQQHTPAPAAGVRWPGNSSGDVCVPIHILSVLNSVSKNLIRVSQIIKMIYYFGSAR